VPVLSPEGVVYSTGPQLAQGVDGQMYYLKGPALEVVAAEASAYQLAELVGLEVPRWAFCRAANDRDIYFASEAVRARSGMEFILSGDGLSNPDFLPRCIAFDLWVANEDRNIGNIVADPLPGERRSSVGMQLYAIDFERAHVLRGTDRFTVGALDPRAFWPKGPLGTRCEGCPFPGEFCSRVAQLKSAQIEGVYERLAWALDGTHIPWRDSASHQLLQRASRLEALGREVWL
jgi:hypothetical protein